MIEEHHKVLAKSGQSSSVANVIQTDLIIELLFDIRDLLAEEKDSA